MRAANEINLKMAPLTPDHHFYIDQGANAHVRLVLVAVGEKLVQHGRPRRAGRRDPLPLQPAARVHRRPDQHGRPGDRGGGEGAKRAAAEKIQPKDWVGTVTATQLAFPYLNLWGFPDKFNRSHVKVHGQVTGIAGSPGVVEGVARVVMSEDEFDSLPRGRDPRLPDDEPGVAGPVRQDHRRS